MSYYETVSTGGDSCDPQWMTVHLYPYDSVRSTCEPSGKVVSALETALDDLISYGSADYYEILRFKTEYYNSPDHVNGQDGETESNFRDYLQNGNGTGEDLYTRVGVHQLFHTGQNACDEDSGGYAPAGANAEGTSSSAFVEPLMAWSPVCNYDDGLTKNAAVQECLHEFIKYNKDDPYTGSNDDQHSLGKVTYFNYTGYVTPLLTYHWDDDKSQVGEGNCPSDTEDRYASEHFQTPTDCTKKAIRDTADAAIDDQLQPC